MRTAHGPGYALTLRQALELNIRQLYLNGYCLVIIPRPRDMKWAETNTIKRLYEKGIGPHKLREMRKRK